LYIKQAEASFTPVKSMELIGCFVSFCNINKNKRIKKLLNRSIYVVNNPECTMANRIPVTEISKRKTVDSHFFMENPPE